MGKKLLAIAMVLVTSQWLFFSTNSSHPGWFSPPWFGTLGFFLSVLVITAFMYLVFPINPQTKRGSMTLFASGLSLIASGLTVTTANFIDQALLGLLSIVYIFIAYYLAALTHSKFGAITEILIIPLRIGVGWYMASLESLKKLWPSVLNYTSTKVKVRKSLLSSVLLGVVITLPVLIVLLTLLTSADPIFSKTLGSLISFDWLKFPQWIVMRILFALFVIVVCVPLLFLKIKERFYSPVGPQTKVGTFPLAAVVLTGSVLLTMIAFLVIQFQYLFANVSETQLIAYGVNTYSEYVRKGFSELLLVSLVTYGVSGLAFVIYRASSKESKVLIGLNFMLLTTTLVFIFSIFRRVYLYQSLHGFTRIRLYGSGFLIIMAVLTIILLLRHLKPKIVWFIGEVGVITLGVILMATVNVDRLIVSVSPPSVNGEVDYVYISRLSPNAVDGWIASYEHVKQELTVLKSYNGEYSEDHMRRILYSHYTVNTLSTHYLRMEKTFGDRKEVKDINFANQSAYLTVIERIPRLDLLQLQNDALELYKRIPPAYIPRLMDRSLNSPLLN